MRGYLHEYADELCSSLKLVSGSALESAVDRIAQTIDRGGTVYVAGNGGSAAISEHLMCDFMKGSQIRVHSLCSDMALLSALANDIGYEVVFAERLRMHGATARDCLILISSSGNSPNVIRAAEYAAALSIPVIAMTGFSGGKLREICDVSIHVPAHNYGVIEDAHEAIMHCLAQYSRAKALEELWKKEDLVNGAIKSISQP